MEFFSVYDGIDSNDSSSSDARAPFDADEAAASGTDDADDALGTILLFEKKRSGVYRVRQCWLYCCLFFSFFW